MTWLWLLLLCPARAQECPGGVCPPAEDLQAVLSVQPASSEDLLPSGHLSQEQLEAFFSRIQQRGGTIRDLLALLGDGHARSIDGDVMRGLLARYGVKLDFLPMDELREVVSDGHGLTFRFDFGRSGRKKLKLPKTTSWVLDGDRPRQVQSGGHTLVVKQEVHMDLSSRGIEHIHKGDLQVKKFFSFNVDAHSEHQPGKVATVDGKPMLATGPDGKPLQADGAYVRKTYDDWIVLEVAGRRIEIGVPALQPRK